jgi:hypothetical protein
MLIFSRRLGLPYLEFQIATSIDVAKPGAPRSSKAVSVWGKLLLNYETATSETIRTQSCA